MRRSGLYWVRHPSGDPKRARVFVIVSREPLILSSIEKSKLSDLVGSLSTHRLSELGRALRFALDL